jgi:hypothetical protein
LFVCFLPFARTSPVQFYDAEKMKFFHVAKQRVAFDGFFSKASKRKVDRYKKGCNAFQIHYAETADVFATSWLP